LSWHAEKMKNLVKNMNEIFDKYDQKMTYFISTYLIDQEPSIFDSFESHDFGPHGHLHLDYTLVGNQNAIEDIYKSVKIFKENNKDPWIFRAPYALYHIGKDPKLLFEVEKKLNIPFDSSINIKQPPWNDKTRPVYHPNGVITIPLIGISDDGLIDNRGLSNSNIILKEFSKALDHGKGGLLVYDMHPIRMGQNKYKNILEELIKFIIKRKNVRITSMRDSVKEFKKKDANETIVSFSGDIDNLSILDYFRRFVI